MIKKHILKTAKAIGLNKVGFTRNSVVALFPYFVADEPGNISMYARGLDYHMVAEEKLKVLEKELCRLGATETRIHIDKGEFDDRDAAFSAGLGFYGQNGMLICEEYGSYFFIGQIVNNLELEPDEPMDRDCLQCGRCERECPARALRDGKVDAQKCVSATSQKRGELSDEEIQLIKNGGLCWGCDMCQRVCPHNRGLKTIAMPEFMCERITELKKGDIDGLSNKEFKAKYGKYAFSWRGKSVLLRNLDILAKATEESNE